MKQESRCFYVIIRTRNTINKMLHRWQKLRQGQISLSLHYLYALMCNKYFIHALMLKSVNKSFLVLIPQVKRVHVTFPKPRSLYNITNTPTLGVLTKRLPENLVPFLDTKPHGHFVQFKIIKVLHNINYIPNSCHGWPIHNKH